jgi:hypothetical protein
VNLSRSFHRLRDRSCAIIASALRCASDVARRAADRLAPNREPSPAATAEAVVQAFAAAIPLPDAPPPTGDEAIDIGNLITYQTALAQHAQRMEQLRAVGALAARFAR